MHAWLQEMPQWGIFEKSQLNVPAAPELTVAVAVITVWAPESSGSQQVRRRRSRQEDLSSNPRGQQVTSGNLGSDSPAHCGEGSGEPSTVLEGVNLPAPESGPERLCC